MAFANKIKTKLNSQAVVHNKLLHHIVTLNFIPEGTPKHAAAKRKRESREEQKHVVLFEELEMRRKEHMWAEEKHKLECEKIRLEIEVLRRQLES